MVNNSIDSNQNYDYLVDGVLKVNSDLNISLNTRSVINQNSVVSEEVMLEDIETNTDLSK